MHFIKSDRGRLSCRVGGFEKENSEIEIGELIWVWTKWEFLVGRWGAKGERKERKGKKKKRKKKEKKTCDEKREYEVE